jgi:fimbrial chaperone protein
MLTIYRASLATIAFLAPVSSVSAASFQVTPTTVEIPVGGAAKTVSVKNTGKETIKAQVRVFRWSMVNGEEKLEPTTDVVASPPIATIKPDLDYTVRVVRMSKAPVATEETYRLLIDEIPDRKPAGNGVVNLAFRYSIPVFFLPPTAHKPDLIWSYSRRDGKLFVTATNTGGRRIRIADISAGNGSGKPITVAKGLAGYVLARSSKSWVAPQGLETGAAPLVIKAQGDLGPIDAKAPLQQVR